VLAGTATAVPKTADGAVEMMRQVKAARDTAVKARTAAIITLKALVVNAPAELREQLSALADKGLMARCTGLRPGPMLDPTASAKHAGRGGHRPGACPGSGRLAWARQACWASP
jgi:transposase